MKTVAGHQPNYLPWAGYFYKMVVCDDFVLGDDIALSRGSFTNRTRVKTVSGVVWLTVPCHYVSGVTPIKHVPIADGKWRMKHLNTLETNYREAPYLADYMPRLRELILADEGGLCDLNMRLIKQLAEWLDISCSFHMSSALGSSGTRDDRIIDQVLQLGGHTYLSGTGGANYQSEAKFKAANLNVAYSSFQPPTYPQLWGKFEPGLSIIDLLFNCGPDSREILKSSGREKWRHWPAYAVHCS